MKRGKRQVKQLGQQQPLKAQTNQTSPQNNYFHNLSSNNHPTSPVQVQSPAGNQVKMPIPTTTTNNQQFNQGSLTKVDDVDEKKRKIQLLKQKYLKKNKVEDNVTVLSNVEKEIAPVQKQQTSNGSLFVNPYQKQLVHEQPKQVVIDKEFKNVKSSHVPIAHEEKIREQQPKKVQSQVIKPLVEQVNDTTATQIEKPDTVSHHEVPKAPSRPPMRNQPPPPPGRKQNLPPSIQPQPLQPEVIKQQQPTKEQKLQTHQTFPVSLQHNKPQLLSDQSTKSQKQDNTSFAPPSSISQQNDTVVQERKVPPPPSRNMKELLNKRLATTKNVPKPPIRGPYQQQSSQGQQLDGFEPQRIYTQSELDEKIIKNGLSILTKPNIVQIDDQYTNIEHQPKVMSHVIPPSKVNGHSKPTVNAQKCITEWLESPQLTLKQLFPQIKETIEFYCLNRYQKLQLTSSNPTYTPLIKQFVDAFMINNSVKYTDEQQQVAESLCLNFFYSSASEFSDTFLVFLLKLGHSYLCKYSNALEDKLPKYLTKILLYKNLFLNEEINVFVNFCLSKSLIDESNLLQFLMLGEDNSQLLQFVSNMAIGELKHSLGVLSFCRLNLKSKNLVGLYLKMISNLESEWAKYGLVEKILNHLKEVDIPQPLYQYTKQLKLRLLKNYENKTQTQGKSETQNSTPQSSKDTGLFGLFNLNKAIDKIKIQTQKALSAVEKQKKPQQEQKKDDIVYDPIRKRYIINGQIPQDEDTPKQLQSPQQKAKTPPPPPMGGTRKAPPPMQGKKPGARLAGNRYA